MNKYYSIHHNSLYYFSHKLKDIEYNIITSNNKQLNNAYDKKNYNYYIDKQYKAISEHLDKRSYLNNNVEQDIFVNNMNTYYDYELFNLHDINYYNVFKYYLNISNIFNIDFLEHIQTIEHINMSENTIQYYTQVTNTTDIDNIIIILIFKIIYTDCIMKLQIIY